MKRLLALLASGTLLLAPVFQTSDHSVRIYSMQQRLRDLGYFNIKATGTYAGLTQTTIARFQQNNGFAITREITQEELDALHSPRAVPQYTQKAPGLVAEQPLEDSAWEQIPLENRCSLLDPMTGNKYNFTVKEKQGFALGSLDSSKDIKKHKKTAVIVTIGGSHYPASMEVTGSAVELHFKGSRTERGVEDAEHRFWIERLLNS